MTDSPEHSRPLRRGPLAGTWAAGAGSAGAGSPVGRASEAVRFTGQQILLGNFDVVHDQVELLLADGFDAIEIRGLRFAEDEGEPEPYLSPLEAEARAAEAWYAAHTDLTAPRDT